MNPKTNIRIKKNKKNSNLGELRKGWKMRKHAVQFLSNNFASFLESHYPEKYENHKLKETHYPR